MQSQTGAPLNRYAFARWIPTLDLMSRPVLDRLYGQMQLLSSRQSERFWKTGIGSIDVNSWITGRQNNTLYAEMTVTLQSIESTVRVEDTGLILIYSKHLDVTTRERAGAYARSAHEFCNLIAQTVHVHLFSHRLKWVHVVSYQTNSIPVVYSVVPVMAERYSREIFERQSLFGARRAAFVDASMNVATRLKNVKISLLPTKDNYTRRMLELMELRVQMNALNESIYTWIGSESYYNRFTDLLGVGIDQTARQTPTYKALEALANLYKEYAESTGSYIMQSAALWLAFIAIVAAVGTIMFGFLPSHVGWLHHSLNDQKIIQWIYLLISSVIVYVAVYYLAARRMAERFIRATSALITSGMDPTSKYEGLS